MSDRKVVTYQSPNGDKINICPTCEQRLKGNWPKDSRGQEYARVSFGLHRGHCDTHTQ